MDSIHIINIAIAIGFIAAIAFSVYFFHKHRETALKLKAMVNKMKRINSKSDASSSQLFSQFTSLIHDEKLYRDVTLDRETICQRLGIERHTLNHLLNEHAGGQSVPGYINNVRMDVAYEMLRDNPDCSIADVAAAVGFTPQNLRIQFKRRYGVTPMEYRLNRQNASKTLV